MTKKRTKVATPESANSKRVVREIAARDAELKALQTQGWRAVDPDGSMARELLMFLELHGSATPEFVSTDIGVEPAIISVYAKALEHAGKVKLVIRCSRHKVTSTVICPIRPSNCGNAGL